MKKHRVHRRLRASVWCWDMSFAVLRWCWCISIQTAAKKCRSTSHPWFVHQGCFHYIRQVLPFLQTSILKCWFLSEQGNHGLHGVLAAKYIEQKDMYFLDPVQKQRKSVGLNSMSKAVLPSSIKEGAAVHWVSEVRGHMFYIPEMQLSRISRIKPSPRAKTLQVKVLVHTLILMSQRKTRWPRPKPFGT